MADIQHGLFSMMGIQILFASSAFLLNCPKPFPCHSLGVGTQVLSWLCPTAICICQVSPPLPRGRMVGKGRDPGGHISWVQAGNASAAWGELGKVSY